MTGADEAISQVLFSVDVVKQGCLTYPYLKELVVQAFLSVIYLLLTIQPLGREVLPIVLPPKK